MSGGELHERLSDLQEQLSQGEIDRRQFLVAATLLGFSLSEALAGCGPKPTLAPATEAPAAATEAPAAATEAPAAATEAPAAATEAPAPATEEAAAPAAVEAKAGHMIRFNPQLCTGCLLCAVACAEKWQTEYFPDLAKDNLNLEFSNIRPMRFQFVDVINQCQYCSLIEWAEGSSLAPCQQVCPEDAIIVVPEGEGEEGLTGMGYMAVDREKCLGLDLCGRCLEICEDQFASGISFDPIEHKAQICSRCGGSPACVDACPEPEALRFVPLQTNGRYFANTPEAYAELLYMKIYNERRTV